MAAKCEEIGSTLEEKTPSDFKSVHAECMARLTEEERQEYEKGRPEAELALDIAELVYTARTEAGLTQSQLAEAMGTGQTAITTWESGIRLPNVATLCRLAQACGKTLDIGFKDAV